MSEVISHLTRKTDIKASASWLQIVYIIILSEQISECVDQLVAYRNVWILIRNDETLSCWQLHLVSNLPYPRFTLRRIRVSSQNVAKIRFLASEDVRRRTFVISYLQKQLYIPRYLISLTIPQTLLFVSQEWRHQTFLLPNHILQCCWRQCKAELDSGS